MEIKSAENDFLQIKGVCVKFGGVNALSNINTNVSKREIRGLIGPNGSGKTTLFNVVTRYIDCDEGELTFDGKDILKRKTHELIDDGIARTFQKSHLFGTMTVLDNIITGLHHRMKTNVFTAALGLKMVTKEENQVRQEAGKILKLISLEEYSQKEAVTLPIGQQRLLELGRAVATNPKLLLLDEPASGMSYAEKLKLQEIIKKIHTEMDVTILVVEHDMKVIMGISDKITVLNGGKIIAEGEPSEIQNNSEVIAAYMGKKK